MVSKLKAFKFTLFHLTLLASLGAESIVSSRVRANIHQGVSGSALTTPTVVESPEVADSLLKLEENVADISLVANASAEEPNQARTDRNRFLKLVSLAFFMLFFVPLGIFYPFFLFYRKLLGVPSEADYLPDEEGVDVAKSAGPIELGFKDEKENNKATISSIQIAFAPPAGQLRHDLSHITPSSGQEGSDAKSEPEDSEQDIVDVMRQVTSVLNAQAEHWTHVNCNSISLPLDEIKPEFDLISYRERSKLKSKKLSFITRGESSGSGVKNTKDYNYVVVTMIFCTAHGEPLFEQVTTKRQLVEELVKVSKMRRDYLIKFNILWNPEEEGKYISNDQLLMEYGDMLRLL